MREALLPDAHRFQNSGVAKLLGNFGAIDVPGVSYVVRLDAADEERFAEQFRWAALSARRRTADHLLQKLHQRVAEVRRYSLLGSCLRCKPFGSSAPKCSEILSE